jgi:nucleoside-diphosphate-sugar epimerase
MKIFVTGATGFIGSAIVQELLGAGHRVLGLARTDAAADALAQAGVEVHRGNLSDTASLAAGARASDGVIHTAFVHDFSDLAAAGETDRVAIEALGTALATSGRPLIVTSGTLHLASGRVAVEADMPNAKSSATHRIASEETTLAFASRGVRAMLLRLPPSVHGDGDHGFIPALIAVARNTGVSAYIGDGCNRWPAVHRLDAAQLYRLAVEKGSAGAIYHGIGDQGVPVREIAEVIGRRLNLPVVAKPAEHFGWLGHFLSVDCPASSTQTRERLGWSPKQPGLIPDLDRPGYFAT